jgi:hypothetical protein
MNRESLRLLRERATATRLTNVSCVCALIEDYRGAVDVAFALHACGNATDLALLQAQRARAVFVVSPCCIGKLKYSIAKAEAAGSCSAATGCAEAETSCVDSAYVKVASNDFDAGGVMPQPLHPRSSFMRDRMPGSDFALLVQFADFADGTCSEQALDNCPQEREHMAAAGDENDADPAFSPPTCNPACDLLRTSRLCKLHVELDRVMAARDVGYWAQMMRLISPLAAAPNKLDLLVGAPAEHAATGCLQRMLSH